MKFYPGTVVERQDGLGADFLNGIFIAGDVVMGQIKSLTGLCTPTLQNWINRGFLSNPKAKKYDKNQLAKILIINSLRKSMKLEDIYKLLYYVNGKADDTSDDIIEEATLYKYICEVVLRDDFSIQTLDNCVIDALSDYKEENKGEKKRLEIALNIICKQLIANSLLEDSEKLFASISCEKNSDTEQ